VVIRQDFGMVAFVNTRIDLTGIQSGIYFVSVKAGNERYEQKLVVSK
jgi:hypothetical protein